LSQMPLHKNFERSLLSMRFNIELHDA
jgi:hypothetical protein